MGVGFVPDTTADPEALQRAALAAQGAGLAPPPMAPGAPIPPPAPAPIPAAPPVPATAPLPPPAAAPDLGAPPPARMPSVDAGAIAKQIAGVAHPPPIAPAPAGAPAATPPAPEHPTTPQDVAEAKKKALAGEAAFKHDANELAQKQTALDQENLHQQAEIERQYQEAAKRANEQIAATHEATKNYKFRDWFTNEDGSKNWARTIGAAIAQAAGAYGAAMTHTANYANQILQEKVKEWNGQQMLHIQNLKDDELHARTGLQDANAARQQALAAQEMKYAGGTRMLSNMLTAASAKASDANDKAAMEAQAKQFDLDAQAAQDAAAERLAKIHLLEAQAAQARAHAAKYGRGAGGGGGGGGTALNTAAGELAKRLQEGADDGKGGKRPLTDAEAIAAANELHVPLEAKAGHVSLSSVRKMAAFDATLAAKGGAQGSRDERMADKEAQEWAKTNEVDKIAKTQRELAAVLQEVKNAPHNPLQQALAVEKAVSAARGGAASKQALSLALHHLGGKWDSIEGMVQAAKDGELGEKQMENFIGFMTNQLGNAQREGKEKYDAFNKYVESQPAEKRAALIAQRGKLFSGLHGFGGPGGGAKPDAAKVARAQAIVNDPSVPEEKKTGARNFLSSVGM